MFDLHKNADLPRVFKVTVPVSSTGKALVILEDYNFKKITHPRYNSVIHGLQMRHTAEIQLFVSEERLSRSIDCLQALFFGESFIPTITKIKASKREINSLVLSEKCLA